ncbi:MAG TPA: hypothetical protein VF905_05630 [Nitrospirota bacterium]
MQVTGTKKSQGKRPGRPAANYWRMMLVAALIFGSEITLRADVAIGVFPIRAEHEVQAGQTKTDGITVDNDSAENVHLRVTVADWHMTRDGSPVFVKKGKSPEFSMSEWIVVNPAEFDLAPHGHQIIRYTFTVPKDTATGGYHTAVMIESVPNIAPGQDAHAAYLNARIGAIIYNRVGKVSPQGTITAQQVVIDQKNTGQLGVQITLKNSGSAHFRFKGESKIIDRQGKLIETLPINDSVVLPQSERDIFVPVKGILPTDGFTIVSSLDIGMKELLEAETRVEPNPSSQSEVKK